MMCSQTLGQLIKSTNKPKNERERSYKINPKDFEDNEPEVDHVKPAPSALIVDWMKDSIFPLLDGDTVGIRVKPGQSFGYLEKYAHQFAERKHMRVTTGHRDGIVWIRRCEGLR